MRFSVQIATIEEPRYQDQERKHLGLPRVLGA